MEQKDDKITFKEFLLFLWWSIAFFGISFDLQGRPLTLRDLLIISIALAHFALATYVVSRQIRKRQIKK